MSSSNGTNTAVTVTASDSTAVLAANGDRQRATIFNNGAATVYLSLGSVATTTSHTLQMAPNSYFEVPGGYRGAITHRGSSTTGTLQVTEL